MGGAVFTPKQQNWQWWEDDAAEPTASLAAENTKPTLPNNTDNIRLRVCIYESGGKAVNNIALDLEYSLNDTDWFTVEAAGHWNYADGQATEGNIVTGLKLGDTDYNGDYNESTGGSGTFDFPDTQPSVEFDICVAPTGTVSGDTTYYFRVLINSTVVELNTGETHPQVLTAPAAVVNRDYACVV